MGCGGSKERGNKSPGGGYSSQNNYDRRPKISVRIQPQVKKTENGPQVIFIFGGPGSRKGRIVDDLCGAYGFKFLCGEQLILQELPAKLANSVQLDSVMDIKELLEDDPSHLTMEWLLSLVSRQIERDPTGTYFVDLMPNLRYMLRSGGGLASAGPAALLDFETQWPVSFALSLAIPADKVVGKQTYCTAPAGDKMKETGGQGDEADVGRTQKRAAMYEASVRWLLDYFNKSERLVTVDVGSGVADLIWHQVHELLCQLDFHPTRTVNTVLLFAFKENDASVIDYEKYLMEKVHLKDVAPDSSNSIIDQLSALSKYVDNQSKLTDSFVILLEGTNITPDNVQYELSKAPVMFMEVHEGYLETYLPGSPKNFIPKMGSTRYRAVCSLENEICLFPQETSPALCRKLAAAMVTVRSS